MTSRAYQDYDIVSITSAAGEVIATVPHRVAIAAFGDVLDSMLDIHAYAIGDGVNHLDGNHEITVSMRDVFGITKFYPSNLTGDEIAKIAGTKTLTDAAMISALKIGFKIIIK